MNTSHKGMGRVFPSFQSKNDHLPVMRKHHWIGLGLGVLVLPACTVLQPYLRTDKQVTFGTTAADKNEQSPHTCDTKSPPSGTSQTCSDWTKGAKSTSAECKASCAANQTVGLSTPVYSKNREALTAHKSDNLYAGGAEDAVAALNDQIALYNKGMNNAYTLNGLTGLATLGAGMHALYLGLSRNSSTSPYPRSVSSDLAYGGLAYTSGKWLYNKDAISAYNAGIRGLACTMLHAEGLLMRQREYGEFANDVEALRLTKFDIENQIGKLRYYLARSAEGDSAYAMNEQERKDINGELKAAYSAVDKAAKLHQLGIVYLRSVEHSGELIHASVDLVIQQVNDQIQAPDLTTLKSVLGKDPAVVLDSLQGLPVTTNPEPAGTNNTSPGATSTPDGDKATAPSDPGNPQAQATSQQANALIANGKAFLSLIEGQHQLQATTQANAKDKATINTINKKHQIKPAVRAGCQQCIENVRQTLRQLVDKLYLIMNFDVRPVLAQASNTYQKNLQIQSCSDIEKPLTLTPSASLSAAAGDKVVWVVSGGDGYPTATAVSNVGKSGPSITSENIVGATRFTMSIPSDATGSLEVVFADRKRELKTTVEITDSKAPAPFELDAKPTSTSVVLTFATPSATGATLKSYSLDLTPDGKSKVTLAFSDVKQGTTATAGTITGTISTVADNKTTLTVGKLTAQTKYTALITAKFDKGNDVASKDASFTTPAAKAAKKKKDGKDAAQTGADAPAKNDGAAQSGKQASEAPAVPAK
ncbi:MAG: hypothetical protein JO142_07170 [Burkholderiales bacterium]|nr:hypothetical protein [Burkholderiales bacterium]